MIKQFLAGLFLISFCYLSSAGTNDQVNIGFTENKGQIRSQYNEPVPDVLYAVSANGFDIFITTSGISYMFKEVIKEKNNITQGDQNNDTEKSIKINWCRMDMELQGARISEKKIVRENEITQRYHGYTNYYLGHCPQGIRNVRTFKSLSILDVYPGISWKLYTTETGLKHEFIVEPNADPEVIKMIYKGSGNISLSADQKEMKISTVFGKITEGGLFSYQKGSKKEVETFFVLENNELTYQLGNYNHSDSLFIDPPLVWSTYYGGGSDEGPSDMAVDTAGNSYTTGYLINASGIFPTLDPGNGAYYAGSFSGTMDTYVISFDSCGVRRWATLFGGSGADWGHAIATDLSGNVFVTGKTSSGNFPIVNLPGAYNNATKDGGFISKFNTAGVLLWSTFFGGTSFEELRDIHVDKNNHVYVTGFMRDGMPVQNPGGGAFMQTTHAGNSDAFIARFNANHALIWSTYYGGSLTEVADAICTDNAGNIYIGGTTLSSDFPVLNPGGGAYFDNTLNDIADAFLVKFNPAGVCLWATYYGGNGNDEYVSGIVPISNGNIAVMGVSNSTDLYTVDPGGGAYYQNMNAGNYDKFILTTNNVTNFDWATYFGGNGLDRDQYSFTGGFEADGKGNIFMSGKTASSNFPVLNPGSVYYDGTYGGNEDLYLSKFTEQGTLVWSTYFGVNGREFCNGMGIDAKGNIYLAGEFANQSGGITEPTLDPGNGAYYQPNLAGGNDDACFLKFGTMNCLSPALVVNKTDVKCYSDTTGSAIVTASGGTAPYAYSWSPIGGTDSIATNLPAGTYTVTVTDGNNNTATQTIPIIEPTAIQLSVPNKQTICEGDTATLPATTTGGTPNYAYQWNTGKTDSAITVNPTKDTSYVVSVTDKNGCTETDTIEVEVVPGLIAIAGPNTTICMGDSVQLIASGGTAYSWSPATGLSNSSVPNPMATPSTNTSYTVTVSSGSCAPATAVVTVNVVPSITASVSPDSSICEGESISLTASGGSSYLWSPAATLSDSLSATVIATPSATTTYSVTVTSGSCAPATNQTTISVSPKPTSTITATQDTIKTGESTTITVSGGTTYLWQPNEGLTDSTTYQHTTSPTITTTYIVSITDSNGCKATETITIYVKTDCDNFDYFLPTAFSPNGDGMNDHFQLSTFNYDCIQSFHLVIYNRWGEKVFESTNPKAKWDGRYRNQPCNTGVFNYLLEIEFIKGEEMLKKGTVNLIK